ncbi:MAG: hypothetical protein O2897_00035 [bacterium]|nr:hypothetical protein [bacterium]
MFICPVTKQELKLSSTHVLELFNHCVKEKQVKNVAGELLNKKVEELYISKDFNLGFVKQEQIYLMLEKDAIQIKLISNRKWQAELVKMQN